MRKIYLVDMKKIDFTFLDKDLQTIEFTLFRQEPIISEELVMDMDTILTFKRAIDDMLVLKEKKLELRKVEK